jgi:hypothetical protein
MPSVPRAAALLLAALALAGVSAGDGASASPPRGAQVTIGAGVLDALRGEARVPISVPRRSGAGW